MVFEGTADLNFDAGVGWTKLNCILHQVVEVALVKAIVRAKIRIVAGSPFENVDLD